MLERACMASSRFGARYKKAEGKHTCKLASDDLEVFQQG
jgi:hypothetical protein